jgi:hypothetical protein
MVVDQAGECALVTSAQGVDERGFARFSGHRHGVEPTRSGARGATARERRSDVRGPSRVMRQRGQGESRDKRPQAGAEERQCCLALVCDVEQVGTWELGA